MKVAELITVSRSLHKMKLGALRKFDTEAITQIPRDQVRLLWSDDWYDGPISGMAQVQGARYLFEMIDRDVLGAEEEHRKYWLIELNADQLNEEEQWYELFCRKVGTHFDFTARPALPNEQVDLAAFYEPYREWKTPDYGNNTVVGWFELKARGGPTTANVCHTVASVLIFPLALPTGERRRTPPG